ncbi:MAG: HEAT repeat domain-containing protein [Halodesulfurarchaeum sp.]
MSRQADSDHSRRYRTLLVTGFVLLGVLLPFAGIAAATELYPVNVHRNTEIVVMADAQRGDPEVIADGAIKQTWTSLENPEVLTVRFVFQRKAVIYGDFLHIGGENKEGYVTDSRDVSHYEIWAKNGPTDSWTMVKEFDGSITKDRTPQVRHNFSEDPFVATKVELRITERTAPEWYNQCDVPIAEYQLIGRYVEEDFQLQSSTPIATPTATPTPTPSPMTTTTSLADSPSTATPATAFDPPEKVYRDRVGFIGSHLGLLGGAGGLILLALGGGVLLAWRGTSDGGDRAGDEAVSGTETGPDAGAATAESDIEPAPDARTGAPDPSTDGRDITDVTPGSSLQSDRGPEGGESDESGDQSRGAETGGSREKPADRSLADVVSALDEPLRDQLSHEDPAERISGIENLTQAAESGSVSMETATKVLTSLTESKWPTSVRVAAIEALGTLEAEEVSDRLKEYRLDTDTEVSKAATKALRKLEG